MKFKVKNPTLLSNHSHPKLSVIFREGFRHSLDRRGCAGSQPTCGTWQPPHIRQGGAGVSTTCILIFTNKILPEFICRQNAKDKFPGRQKKNPKKTTFMSWLRCYQLPCWQRKGRCMCISDGLTRSSAPRETGLRKNSRAGTTWAPGKQFYPQASTSTPREAGKGK